VLTVAAVVSVGAVGDEPAAEEVEVGASLVGATVVVGAAVVVVGATVVVGAAVVVVGAAVVVVGSGSPPSLAGTT
jgi:hypothetical protein